ncbi:MAG: hypothetical protein ACJ788_18955 [Ktedonobacteraceae bacterium]
MTTTSRLTLFPLLTIESLVFREHYERGVRWSLQNTDNNLIPASFFVNLLKTRAPSDDQCFRSHLGFVVGTYHGAVLSPQTDKLRAGVSQLAHLDHKHALRGYDAGREFVFVDAESDERRLTETQLIRLLAEDVSEMTRWHDSDDTWFFSVGCRLGELSAMLFPMTKQERNQWNGPVRIWHPLPEYQSASIYA